MEFASLFCQSDRPRRPPDYFSFETAPPKPAPRVAKAKLDARSLNPPLGASASAELKNGACSLPEQLGACPKSLPPAEIEVFYNRAQRMLLKEVFALRCPTALQLTCTCQFNHSTARTENAVPRLSSLAFPSVLMNPATAMAVLPRDSRGCRL